MSGRGTGERVYSPTFWAVSAGHFFLAAAFWTFPLFPLWFARGGAGDIQLGMLVALEPLAAIAVRPWVGRWMDGRGRRHVFRVAGALHVVALSGYLLVDPLSPWTILVRVLHGVSVGALFSTFFTYASDIAPESRRTEALAIFGISGMAPSAITPWLGERLIEDFGFPEFFAAAAAIGAISWALSWFLPEPVRDHDEAARRLGFLEILLSPKHRLLWVTALVFSVSMASYLTFLTPWMDAIDGPRVGPFFLAYAAAAVGLRIVGGRIPDRLGPQRVVAPALASLAVGLYGLAVLSWRADSVVLVSAGVACGLGHGFLFPVLTSLSVARTPPSARGTTVSLFTALIDTGHMIGPAAFGVVAALASYPAVFLVAAVVTTGTMVAWIRPADGGGEP